MTRRAVHAVIALPLLLAACAGEAIPDPIADDRAPRDDAASVQAQYPTIHELYGAAHGLRQTCAVNDATCHQAQEFPNLSHIGSIVGLIDQPCNRARQDPAARHDMCETVGDRLVFGEDAEGAPVHVEIAWIEALEPDPRTARAWRIVTREPMPTIDPERGIEIARKTSAGLEATYFPVELGATVRPDPERPDAIRIDLPGPVASVPSGEDDEYGEEDPGLIMAAWFAGADAPGEPAAIHQGDPNRNGVFGAELGAAFIRSGAPERSYMITRLTDPAAGPLMPRANCEHWSRASLRALWCWIAGLAPGGTNAFDPIDYANCPAGPAAELNYDVCPAELAPERASGMSLGELHAGILEPSCAGCHQPPDAPHGLDLSTPEAAHAGILDRLTMRDDGSFDVDASLFLRRVDPRVCGSEPGGCMPRGSNGLDRESVARLRAWVESGAPLD